LASHYLLLGEAMNTTLKETLSVSVQANVSKTNVKRQSRGRSQNGQPVEFGQPLFVIG
jgi:hypothetical protein